jgi:Protein of unknown function DUF262/Protein of unknown function (DUF1524)
MPKEVRLTNSSNETELDKLFSGDLVFSIPYFQRAYKWKPDKLKELDKNLLQIIDADDSHFLGAIIIYQRPQAVTSDPTVYDVIDGQQRITTVFLYISAIVRTFCKNKLYEEAAGAFLKYMVVNRETKLASNSRVHCGKEDRAQLNRMFEDVLKDKPFADQLAPFKYKPLPAAADGNARLWNNYRAALRFLDEQVKREGIDRLRDLYNALIGSMTVVQIVVKSPTDGPKIFDSLNSRQEPMTTGDLVRNEIFSRVAAKPPQEIEDIDQRSWQPFYSRFREGQKSLFDDYFFPYGLIQNPNVRKSEVYEGLRAAWKEIDDPEEIIKRLADYQSAFLDVATGTNTQNHPPSVRDAFAHLYAANAPSSTYPFLMQLSNASRDQKIDAGQAVAVLSVIESFLVRRAICGHEPTGLHAVFKRLWVDCDESPTAKNVEKTIRSHKTVVWPNDASVREAVINRPLYGSSITAYVLLQWNRQVGGDQPTTKPWIEHVLPDKPVDDWFKLYTHEQHTAMKDLLANLLPLSKEMNQALGNRPYADKKKEYLDDSGFKAAREFAKEHDEWSPEKLGARSKVLSEWVISRWPQ